MFNEMYSSLCQESYGLSVDSIKLVESNELMCEHNELLSKFGIDFDEVIVFDAEDEGCDVDSYTDEHLMIGGLTIFFLKSGNKKAAIFINKNPLSDGLSKDFIDMLNYMYLIHELGHVDDFFNGVNFGFDDSGWFVDLVKAEAYADIFALKKLKRNKDVYSKLALSYYAKSVLGNAQKNEFYEQVFLNIKKKILESKIRQWASN